MAKANRILLITAPLLFSLIAGAFAALFYHGILLFNNPSSTRYPVRGVDVSAYQGDIDWAVLSRQNIHFAFIKATDGSDFVDRCFQTNFKNALSTGLRVGAYHFFSRGSTGKAQAEHYIATVPKIDGVLPPVVDFELYGDNNTSTPEREVIRAELSTLLYELEAYYGLKPILYATETSYSVYLSGYYDSYDLWIRNVFTRPKLLRIRLWTFWQYTNRARLDGYHGDERYIDLNVFNGTLEEFYNYPNN